MTKSELAQTIENAFKRSDIIETKLRFLTVLSDGTAECCLLGAAYVAIHPQLSLTDISTKFDNAALDKNCVEALAEALCIPYELAEKISRMHHTSSATAASIVNDLRLGRI